jgi:nucleotide-binding universal stress UspA family protein
MPGDRASASRDALGAVVVGVDGTDGSLAALRWAIAEAGAHGAPLCVVHVLDPRARRRAPYARPRPDAVAPGDRTEADNLLARAVAQTHAPVDVRRVFEIGNPAEALLRSAEGAQMLVLGHTPRRLREPEDIYQGPALGSIARACVAHATCPVVVVPAPERHQDLLVPQGFPTAATAVPQPVEGVRTLYPRYRATPVCR